MRNLWIILVFLFSGCTVKPLDRFPSEVSVPKFEILSSEETGVDFDAFKSLVRDTIQEFETNISPLKKPLNISIGAAGCLRVGYSFEKDEVQFCDVRDVQNNGTRSRDVVRHELFHAMLCNVRPEVCDLSKRTDEAVALHEGLADFFAHARDPDDCFGENFYAFKSCVREYKSSVCYSLVKTPHEKGNAIASFLISSGVSLPQVSAILLKTDFTARAVLKSLALPPKPCFDPDNAPDYDIQVTGYPASALNKYWLKDQVPLIVTFKPSPQMVLLYSSLQVRWTGEGGGPLEKMQITPRTPLSFSVVAVAGKGTEKATASFYNESVLVGSVAFYFGRRKTP